MEHMISASEPALTLNPDLKSKGLSANALKGIAIAAMLIDHIAHVFVPYEAGGAVTALYFAMRMIGRITGPIMFYMAAEGFYYTRNQNRYLVRLGAFALVSYLPFILCFSGGMPNAENWQGFLELNVIYTIFLGICALRLRHSALKPVVKWGGIALLMALSVFGDWAFMGVALILVFDYYRGDFKKQAFAYCIIILLQSSSVIAYPVYVLLGYYPSFDWTQFGSTFVNLAMLLPMLLLRFYNGEKGAGGAVAKYGFYLFYPAHLLALYLIQLLR